MAGSTSDEATAAPTQGIMEPPSLQTPDMPTPTSNDTASWAPGNMEPPSSTQRKGRLGFLDLPPEVRNRIYSLLFSNNTIHFDGTDANPENRFTLCIDLCTAPSENHAHVTRLTDAAHVAVKEEDHKKREEEAAEPIVEGFHLVRRPVQSEEDKRREVCDSNRFWTSHQQCCRKSVQLSTQFLRTSRQVYLDVALLSYCTNTFNIRGGLHDIFCDAFVQKFSSKQRCAIQTAIVTARTLKCVQKIPELLPGLKHLWLRALPGFRCDGLEEDYARVKLPNLVGAAVQMGKRLGGGSRICTGHAIILRTWSGRSWTTKIAGISRRAGMLCGPNCLSERLRLMHLWIRMISLGECSLVLQPKRDNGFRVWLGCSRSRFGLCGLESEYSRFFFSLSGCSVLDSEETRPR